MRKLVGNRSSKGYSVLLRLLLVVFIVLYLVCPRHTPFNATYYWAIFCLYFFALFCFFRAKCKTNYLDFETIFLLFCSIEHFVGCLYLGTEVFDNIFFRGIDYSLIIKSTLLSAVGLCAYMVGSISYARKEITKERITKEIGYQNVSLKVVFYLFCLCVLLFIYADGFSVYRNMYRDEANYIQNEGLAFQALALVTIFSNIYCAVLFLRLIKGSLPSFRQMMFVLVIFVFAIALAIVGNRTFFSYIVLPFVLCYCAYVKKMDLRRTIVLLTIGFIAMYVLQVTRQGRSEFSSNFLSAAVDIVIPSQTLYFALDYVEKYGLNYGASMLPPLYGCIPGLSSFLGPTATTGSAEIISRYVETGSQQVGLGTTIIVDVYISFGFLGVFFFMWYMGVFVNKTWKSPLLQMLVQCAVFSSAVFIGRGSYFLPARFILWSIVFTYLFNNFLWKGKRKR